MESEGGMESLSGSPVKARVGKQGLENGRMRIEGMVGGREGEKEKDKERERTIKPTWAKMVRGSR